MFSMFKNLVGSKMLTKEDLVPVLDKMREHLVGKILKLTIFTMHNMKHGDPGQSAPRSVYASTHFDQGYSFCVCNSWTLQNQYSKLFNPDWTVWICYLIYRICVVNSVHPDWTVWICYLIYRICVVNSTDPDWTVWICKL